VSAIFASAKIADGSSLLSRQESLQSYLDKYAPNRNRRNILMCIKFDRADFSLVWRCTPGYTGL
jgi:hypothetical protein